jgi:hypothetical protein
VRNASTLVQEVFMIQQSQRPTRADEERKREATWQAATAEVIAVTADRFTQLARTLGLEGRVARAFVRTAMEAARQYQTGCKYANYERRTGHPYPDEGRENEDAARAAAWDVELSRLAAIVAAERPR